MEEVILVDELDNPIGLMEKLEAHEKALLHRALSVLIFNSKNEFLLQQRSDNKYHSPGLWTNTCCSHPRAGETVEEAAERRLKEEMGMSCQTQKVFHFTYKAEFENGLTEHELDHVFLGKTDSLPVLNPDEAKSYRYLDLESLISEIESHPENFTPWFKIIIQKHLDKIKHWL
jgi:isopentenyl-diphosphate Delta-isomerase